MRQQSPAGQRATLWMRCVVGVGFLVAGIAAAVGGHPAYLPGDQRGGPFFWPVVGLATAVVGVAFVAYAIRDLRRSRHDA